MTRRCGSPTNRSIYRDLYMPSRKVFDTNMFHRLRSDRSIRRPRGKKRSHGRGQIRNMVSIRERPTEADTRQVVGHWEGDLVFGARPSAVATLVDRATRYAMVVALPDGNKADAVARALIHYMGRLPAPLRRSLTWDRGSEMAQHSVITAALALPVFFCDPHHPWQSPMAARHQREHEPTAAPIPAQERRSDRVHSGRAQRRCRETQPPPAPSTWLGHSGRGIRGYRADSDACACLAGAVLGCDHGRWPLADFPTSTSPVCNAGARARSPNTFATRSASNATSHQGI